VQRGVVNDWIIIKTLLWISGAVLDDNNGWKGWKVKIGKFQIHMRVIISRYADFPCLSYSAYARSPLVWWLIGYDTVAS
jgi:hypothetical protein